MYEKTPNIEYKVINDMTVFKYRIRKKLTLIYYLNDLNDPHSI